jgi:Fe-S oxidoreductase
LKKIYEPDLRKLLKKCYQCARCSGVCQASKVQKYAPSRIIQLILEGFEDKVIKDGVLWDCLTCNSCLQTCPKDINFADIVRNARYKMQAEGFHNLDRSIAHKGVFPTIAELMSKSEIKVKRPLDWAPKGCNISDHGTILYYVGCLPFFNVEFKKLDPIASNTLQMICRIENTPIVVLEDEICCGHDLYWGQGKFEVFVELAKKNMTNFEKAGISTIITACAECYRTFKVDYPNLFENFNEKFIVKHTIGYLYDKWKEGIIDFKKPNAVKDIIPFTYHDPCRLSRFLPKDNNLLEQIREIFISLKDEGYEFKEMEHNKENSLCCGVSSWMNCNERSKALRYTRLLEAKEVGTKLITTCPKCRIHFTCLQEDHEDVSSIEILDLSQFLVNMIHVIDPATDKVEEI